MQLHINYAHIVTPQFYTLEQNDTLKTVLELIKQNPKATQQEIANQTGKGIATIKRATEKLVSLGKIERRNGKRNGYWAVNNEYDKSKQ